MIDIDIVESSRRAMTPTELGQELARLVWESFSDMFTESASIELLNRMNVLDEESNRTKVAEEVLIYILWAHTRGIQQAYAGQESDLAAAALDELHRALFEDLADNGIGRSELPIFEQRIAERYARYQQAAKSSDMKVGSVAVELISGRAADDTEVVHEMATRAISVTAPIADFYAEVELSENGKTSP